MKVHSLHGGIAIEYLGTVTDCLGEGGDRIAALCGELDVREDGDIEAKSRTVEQGDLPRDDASLLQVPGCGASRWS